MADVNEQNNLILKYFNEECTNIEIVAYLNLRHDNKSSTLFRKIPDSNGNLISQHSHKPLKRTGMIDFQ